MVRLLSSAATLNECIVKKERCSWYTVSNCPSSCIWHCDVCMYRSVWALMALAHARRKATGEGTWASTFCATIASRCTGNSFGGQTFSAPQKPTWMWWPLAMAVCAMLAAGSTPYVFHPRFLNASSCEPSLQASSRTARGFSPLGAWCCIFAGKVATSADTLSASHSKWSRSVLLVPLTYR